MGLGNSGLHSLEAGYHLVPSVRHPDKASCHAAYLHPKHFDVTLHVPEGYKAAAPDLVAMENGIARFRTGARSSSSYGETIRGRTWMHTFTTGLVKSIREAADSLPALPCTV